MMIQRPRHLATAATISPGVSFGDVEVLAKIQFLAGEARGGRGGRGAAGASNRAKSNFGFMSLSIRFRMCRDVFRSPQYDDANRENCLL
jgi:hypothetical protein